MQRPSGPKCPNVGHLPKTTVRIPNLQIWGTLDPRIIIDWRHHPFNPAFSDAIWITAVLARETWMRGPWKRGTVILTYLGLNTYRHHQHYVCFYTTNSTKTDFKAPLKRPKSAIYRSTSTSISASLLNKEPYLYLLLNSQNSRTCNSTRLFFCASAELGLLSESKPRRSCRYSRLHRGPVKGI